MNNALITIRHLTKRFAPGVPPALENISAELPKGEIIGVVGPDGAGKTTLMRLMAGLMVPTTGSLTVNGLDTVTQAQQLSHIIGYMPQKFGLYEDLTVMQNLNLYADLRNVVADERDSKLKKLLSFTSLEPFVDRFAKDLSGGMKQKLGLACALVKTPTLLLLDEPSVGVDPLSRRELWKMVYDLVDEGITVVWSTSYLDEAERCMTTLLLNEGQLLFYGPPAELAKRVEGRTFLIKNIEGSRRQVLFDTLVQENVLDGVIQGADVRIVTKEKKEPPFSVETPMQVVAIPPRFEDAFIDILGGGPKEFSVLAENTPPIEASHRESIVADHLTKRFGTFVAANDITFKVEQGEIFGLLGPNGAGKSTTFKMMCGLLKPNAGKAFVNGVNLYGGAAEIFNLDDLKAPGLPHRKWVNNISNMNPFAMRQLRELLEWSKSKFQLLLGIQTAPIKARSHIGYMSQKFSLYGNLSVYQNMEFFSGIYNLYGKEQEKRINQMIDIFNFKPFLDESAEMLPLGFKQRLALACATMHGPEVLFLDEPTSGVDPLTRREFWNHINGLVHKGVTVMVTTHFMEEAEYCDRIGLVYRSKLIQVGTPDELKKSAATESTPFPTLEDAFIHLIEQYEAAHHG